MIEPGESPNTITGRAGSVWYRATFKNSGWFVDYCDTTGTLFSSANPSHPPLPKRHGSRKATERIALEVARMLHNERKAMRR